MTGKPLGVTGEVAEDVAATVLRLDPAQLHFGRCRNWESPFPAVVARA